MCGVRLYRARQMSETELTGELPRRRAGQEKG